MSVNSNHDDFDIAIIGGGINGVGIANDAAGRGLKVLLCEQNDLASATSSASSKLIHGGLRYLEYYEFRLVREALAEREILLAKAPHIIAPTRFQIPYQPHLRPRWMIRLGLFFYDFLAKRTTLTRSQSIRFDQHSPLNTEFTHGFEYSDAVVDDSRLVVLNAIQAREQGATILTRHRCQRAVYENERWQLTLEEFNSGTEKTQTAKLLINAAGPWVDIVSDRVIHRDHQLSARLVQGAHIVVPKITPDDKAFLLQNRDGRVVFVIPYQKQYSLIGTTDEDFQGDPSVTHCTDGEKHYLIGIVNQYFRQTISVADIVWDFAGVRPLVEEMPTGKNADKKAQQLSRDYQLIFATNPGPILTVYGGKITTYRKLAEHALEKLQPQFANMQSPWTADKPLPGGDFTSRKQRLAQWQQRFPWLPQALAERWLISYGTIAEKWLEQHHALTDFGPCFGANLYQFEVDYLRRCEWAQSVDDILWRRTKLGLEFSPAQRQMLESYLKEQATAGEVALKQLNSH